MIETVSCKLNVEMNQICVCAYIYLVLYYEMCPNHLNCWRAIRFNKINAVLKMTKLDWEHVIFIIPVRLNEKNMITLLGHVAPHRTYLQAACTTHLIWLI